MDLILDNNNIFMINGGLETTLIYKYNLELPFFSCIDLFKNVNTKKIIYQYYLEYLKVAQKYNSFIIIDTPTWRFNKDWASKLGYNEIELLNRNKEAVVLISKLKNDYNNIIISGKIGPKYEGYFISEKMSIEESKNYHSTQIKTFSELNIDIITASAMNYVEEAIGISYSAKDKSIPLVISFTLNNDSKLPSGMALEDAINYIDYITNEYPIYYMINCVHPKYFIELLRINKDKKWINRIRGIRPNASSKSHEELEKLNKLDSGNIDELANYCKEIKNICPNINIFGGCCGTNINHVESIYKKIKNI